MAAKKKGTAAGKLGGQQAWTKERVAAMVANPAHRRHVPVEMLPAKYRQMREQNTRFRQPLVEGSSVTYGDVARRRKADETLQFGADPVGRAQENERITGSYYDQYLRDLDAHRQRVEGYGAAANTQADMLARQAGKVSAPEGMSLDNNQVAAQAAAVRGQLAGGMGTELAGRGRAASTLASLMQASGSGSKAQALGQARRNTEDVRSKLGAFRTKYMADARDSESKNVLAVQLATGKLAASAAEGAADRAADAGKVNQYGYTNAQWSKMTPEQRRQAAADWKKATTGKTPKKDKTKSPWLPQSQQNTLANAFESARQAVGEWSATGASRAELARLLSAGGSQKVNGKTIKIPRVGNNLALKMALDMQYNGGRLSRGTVKLLHDKGYKIKSFGVPIDSADPNQRLRDKSREALTTAGAVLR